MNTAALKSFAPAVRHQLMEAVTQKLDFVLSARTPDYLTTFARQVGELRMLAQTDRPGLIERVAYTWFNRFAALRYLDAKGWHPFRARVLTAASTEETQPEILKLARTGSLPEELRSHVKAGPARLNDLLDGRIPSPDPQGEVYRHLVLAACHFYHILLPDLFERLADETELLLPDDLLTEQSVVQGFRAEITDSDCAEVEILGWLYQFYISEKKDAVMGRKAAVPTEDIPAVTQIFTPHWIVRYLVENSLGRLWLLNRPGSRLRERMPYYVEGEPETEFLRISKPEEIRILDPAVGSGHMLTYAFDLLCAMYEEDGYAPSEIPGLILTHNLYGVDICPRAAQLAELALVLKSREKSRRFFQADMPVRPRILCMTDVEFGEHELRDYVDALELGGLFTGPVMELLYQFEKATTFGSLISPCLAEDSIASIRAVMEIKDLGGRLFLHETHTKVLCALGQAEYLARRYHVVVANPPYMGIKSYDSPLKSFVKKSFPAASQDLYACFMLRNCSLTQANGYAALITIPNWMFLSSFEELRGNLLRQTTIVSLVHNGRGVWGSDFGSCAFVILLSRQPSLRGVFKRLFHRQGEVQSNEELEANFFNVQNFPSYSVASHEFTKLPGQAIAYWISKQMRSLMERNPLLGTIADFKQGMSTTDSDRFVRLWYELAASRITFSRTEPFVDKDNGGPWFPFNKGGGYKKWYGNQEFVVRYEENGNILIEIVRRKYPNISDPEFVIKNRGKYFRKAITYTSISSANFGVRFLPQGFIFSVAGPVLFVEDSLEFGVLALLCTRLASHFLEAINPSLGFQGTDIAKIPLPDDFSELLSGQAAGAGSEAIQLARADWDNFENSWDFRDLPLLRSEVKQSTLEASWKAWRDQCDAAITRMKELETDNNRLFINAYGLQDEFKPEISEDQITLTHANARRDMAALISYAVGCMMGRYSLDKLGLILANAGDTLDRFIAIVGKPKDQLRFVPSEEGIVPVLDGEWFEDDIVARTREFIRATFGEATLRENVRFMEESLGKDLRKYFLTDFYKDHLQTYRKRPIYWLVQSPRKGFSVLVYLHRYSRDTMNLVLNRYLREYQVKLRNRAEHLVRVLASEGNSTREKTDARREADKINKTLHECEEWERQTVLPLAQARIGLDLDDGVKVNYLKLGEALASVAGMESKDEE
jgi:hypothetical protein